MARQKKIKPEKDIVEENSALDLLNKVEQNPIKEDPIKEDPIKENLIDEAVQPDIKKTKKTKILKNTEKPVEETSYIDPTIDYVYITFPCGSPFFLEKSYLSRNKLLYPELINICTSTIGSSKNKYNLAKLFALKRYAILRKASYICFIDKNFKLNEYIDFKDILKKQNKTELILVSDQCFLIKSDSLKEYNIDINKTLLENIKILSSKLNTVKVEY